MKLDAEVICEECGEPLQFTVVLIDGRRYVCVARHTCEEADNDSQADSE